jgi:C4-dicarboxylate-specific signal transduction histidine kinase
MHENEFMQVVINILKNAQDNFKDKGTINPKITITTQSNEKSSVLKICDNGGGIERNIMDEIFKPYFSTKNKQTGTGLGLYMSKIIIESHHNGKFYAENISNIQGEIVGACFIIDLIEQ